MSSESSPVPKQEDMEFSEEIQSAQTAVEQATKRALQNRAAQRAFRARRKTRVTELEAMEIAHQNCEAEKESLRSEIAQLRAKLAQYEKKKK